MTCNTPVIMGKVQECPLHIITFFMSHFVKYCMKIGQTVHCVQCPFPSYSVSPGPFLWVWEGPGPKFSRCGRAHVLSPKHAYLGMKWRARSLENSNFGLQNKNVNIFFKIYSNQISFKTNNFLYHKHACFGLRRWTRGKPLTSARSSFFTDFASPPPTQDSSWFCSIFYYNYDSLKNKLII